MKINSLNDAMEILQRDTTLSKLKVSLGEDVSIDSVLDHSGDHIPDSEFAQYLSSVVDDIGYTKAEVLARSGINEIIGFQIFSGITLPGFNTLMRICLAAGFTLDEAQKAIELAGYKKLNSSDPRDAIIIRSLTYLKSIDETNNILYSSGYPIM